MCPTWNPDLVLDVIGKEYDRDYAQLLLKRSAGYHKAAIAFHMVSY